MAKYRKLGRTSAQRKALLRNQVTAVINNGKIVTTEAKAKEVQKIVDGLIALAVKEKDNFETVKVTTKVARKDKDGKRVKQIVDKETGKVLAESHRDKDGKLVKIENGVTVTVYDEVSIVKCRVKRYRRAGLSGLQKKHYAKLYRVGKLKKRPYSQVWKYREDIRKMHKLQEQYLFLARHNIHSAEELVGTIASLTDKKKETSAEKSRIYKARERSRELFTAADEMENLKPAEQSYRLGDTFFEDEHRKWVALEQELQAQGYSLEEVQALRRHYKEEYSEVCAKEKVVFRELNTGKAILNSMIPDSISDGRKTEYNREIIRDRKEQPVR